MTGVNKRSGSCLFLFVSCYALLARDGSVLGLHFLKIRPECFPGELLGETLLDCCSS